MSSEKNKAIVRRFTEEFNKRNLAILNELIAPDCVDHTHQLRGLENAKQFFTMLIKGFPDYQFTIEDMIAEGDKVWVRFKERGTHRRISWISPYLQEDHNNSHSQLSHS